MSFDYAFISNTRTPIFLPLATLRFSQVRQGMNFLSLTQHEPPPREHSDIMEEKIDKITKHNAKDEWGLPSRPSIYKGYMEEKYMREKAHEDEALNKTKVAQWRGNIHDRLVGEALRGAKRGAALDCRYFRKNWRMLRASFYFLTPRTPLPLQLSQLPTPLETATSPSTT